MKKKDQVEIVDVFVMHEWYYKWGGVWPLRKDNIKFGIYVVYSMITVILIYIDMIAVFGNLHLLVENLLETLVTTASLFMILVSDEERYLYYAYNRIAYTISKIAMPSSVMTVMAMYIKPLPNALRVAFKSLGHNSTVLNEDALVIPFQGMQMLHITDLRIYFCIYIYRLPFVYFGICHTLTVCFVLSLVLHVCGRMSVLNQRIKVFETKSKQELETAIRRQVQAHLQLIEIVKSIENIFQYILLFDLLQSSLRLGLSSYVALKSKDAGSEFVVMCTFTVYAIVIFLILYLYCFVGEYLTQESKNLTEAYYHCNWREMPLSCKSSLMICMICSQNHLSFTAGKFYKFSLYGFTGIVKTSMAYLSMLRAVV